MDKDEDENNSSIIKKAKEQYLGGKYSEHLMNIFLGICSVVPVASAFSSLAKDYIPTKKQEKIEQFISDLANEVIRLESKIDETRIQTEHYAFLFEQCIKGVSESYQQEKLDCYKAILMNAAMPSSVPDDLQEYYLDLVHRLTPSHIKLLSILYKASQIPRGGQSQLVLPTISNSFKGFDGDHLVSLYSELASLNFTNTKPENFASLTSIPLDRVEGRINSTARKFIEFITLEHST